MIITTYRGREIDVLRPTVSDIYIEDIAHALSMICRYGGHSERFYSVAEHCVHLSNCATEENALEALMHDSAEAYIGGIVRPIKDAIPEFQRIEDKLYSVIASRYNFHGDIPEEVHSLDDRILVNEECLLMPRSGKWPSLAGLRPLAVELQFWTPQEAEAAFLQRFYDLQRLRSGFLMASGTISASHLAAGVITSALIASGGAYLDSSGIHFKEANGETWDLYGNRAEDDGEVSDGS